MNLGEAILKIIGSHKGGATNAQIYSELEEGTYFTLSASQLAKTRWSGRPAYRHEVRSYLSNFVKRGLLEHISRGLHALPTTGKNGATKKGGTQESQVASDINVLEGRVAAISDRGLQDVQSPRFKPSARPGSPGRRSRSLRRCDTGNPQLCRGKVSRFAKIDHSRAVGCQSGASSCRPRTLPANRRYSEIGSQEL